MPSWVLNSAPSPMDSNMETWMSLCGNVCFAVIPLLFPDIGQNVYIHQYMYFCLPDSQCLLHPISILTWKDGFFCVALCACSSHLCLVPLLGYNMYMHQYMNLCPFYSPCVLHVLWKCSWNHGDPSVALWICHLHYFSSHIYWLECVHTSVHVFMSICPPISFWPPMHNYMETWVPLCTTFQ